MSWGSEQQGPQGQQGQQGQQGYDYGYGRQVQPQPYGQGHPSTTRDTGRRAARPVRAALAVRCRRTASGGLEHRPDGPGPGRARTEPAPEPRSVPEPEPEPEPEPGSEPEPDAGPAKGGGRDRYFDALRAIALVRVVAYHTFGWAWAGLVFPSMGVMFTLAS